VLRRGVFVYFSIESEFETFCADYPLFSLQYQIRIWRIFAKKRLIFWRVYSESKTSTLRCWRKTCEFCFAAKQTLLEMSCMLMHRTLHPSCLLIVSRLTSTEPWPLFPPKQNFEKIWSRPNIGEVLINIWVDIFFTRWTRNRTIRVCMGHFFSSSSYSQHWVESWYQPCFADMQRPERKQSRLGHRQWLSVQLLRLHRQHFYLCWDPRKNANFAGCSAGVDNMLRVVLFH